MSFNETDVCQAVIDMLQAQDREISNPQVDNLQPPGGGFSNQTWLLDISFDRAGERVSIPAVLRLAPDSEALYQEYDLSVQYTCMQQLAGSGIPVPNLLGFEPDPARLGVPFFLMERVGGRPVQENPLYHLTGWLYDLPHAEQAQHWNAGIDLLGKLVHLDWQASGLGFLEQDCPRERLLGQQLEEQGGFLAWVEERGRPYPLLHRALGWLQANQPPLDRVVLCWGDAKLGNCMFAENGEIVSVLDWEGAHLGDPVEDLAWWLFIDQALSEGYGYPRLAGLPSRDQSVARWTQASGLPAVNLDYYEVLAAFKLSLIMARLGCLFTQQGLMPADMEMDINNGPANLLKQLATQHGF